MINYIYNLMIGIRITPNQEVCEFDPDTDREYINMDKDGYFLKGSRTLGAYKI